MNCIGDRFRKGGGDLARSLGSPDALALRQSRVRGSFPSMSKLRIAAILLLTASQLSAQQYDGWTRTSQYLTMRDGVRLATDIFRPTKGGVLHTEKLPVVWTHHRYHRAFFRNDSLIAYPGGFGRGMDLLLKNGYI